jgi:hypothetical protein
MSSNLSGKNKQYDVLKYADNEFVKTYFWSKEIIPLLLKDYNDENSLNECSMNFWEQFCGQIAYLLKAKVYRYRFIFNSSYTLWTEKVLTPLDEKYSFSFEMTGRNETLIYSFHDHEIIQKIYRVNKKTYIYITFKYLKDRLIEVHYISDDELEEAVYYNTVSLIRKATIFVIEFIKSKSLEYQVSRTKIEQPFDKITINKIYTADIFKKETINKMLYELRLRLYDYLRSEKIENFDINYPLSIFFLEAFYEDNKDYPSFGYFFDLEQLNFLKRKVKMSKEELDYIQSKEMMSTGQGLCGRVAIDKTSVYVSNWKKATKDGRSPQLNAASAMTIRAEEKFIGKYPQLYEWPILEKNTVRFVLCLACKKGGSLLTSNIRLNLQQIFYKEFINIIFFINTIELFVNQIRFLSSEIAFVRSNYSHFFTSRFINPTSLLLSDLENKILDSESKELIMAVRSRLNNFNLAIQTISFRFIDKLETNKEICNISDILRNELTFIFNLNKRWISKVRKKDQYNLIKLDSYSIEDDLKVTANKEYLEQAFLSILLNTLETDVFTYKRVLNNPEECYVKITARSEQKNKKKWIVIFISNNGEPVNVEIKNRLQQMFLFYKKIGLSKLIDYQINSITGRKAGEHTGTGLLFSATVFSSIERGKRTRGYIELDSSNSLTIFKIFLPVN